ncbi:MAG: hypothetical protein M3501_01385 [Actinomycetota bacterium]|nr:hypothetical protein [Actinomycetota bacterium]
MTVVGIAVVGTPVVAALVAELLVAELLATVAAVADDAVVVATSLVPVAVLPTSVESADSPPSSHDAPSATATISAVAAIHLERRCDHIAANVQHIASLRSVSRERPNRTHLP